MRGPPHNVITVGEKLSKAEILQVKYYSASEFEVNRYNEAILKYQVGME